MEVDELAAERAFGRPYVNRKRALLSCELCSSQSILTTATRIVLQRVRPSYLGIQLD